MNHRSGTRGRTRGRLPRGGGDAPQQELRRLERDSFILLQHAYNLCEGDRLAPVNPGRLACDLGFTAREAARIVRYLSWVGYLKESPSGPHLTLSDEGIAYLEHERGRRCSVRCEPGELPDPVVLAG